MGEVQGPQYAVKQPQGSRTEKQQGSGFRDFVVCLWLPVPDCPVSNYPPAGPSGRRVDGAARGARGV